MVKAPPQVPKNQTESKRFWIFKPISKRASSEKIIKPRTSSDFQIDFQNPLDFQTDFQGDEKFMIEINAKITFDSYEFRRVKPMGSNCVLYTKQNLIGKEVCIIPVDMHTTDRYIESCKDENGQYHLQMQIKEVIYKKVTEGGNTGRIYMNSKYLGVDCIIVEAPNLNYFD